MAPSVEQSAACCCFFWSSRCECALLLLYRCPSKIQDAENSPLIEGLMQLNCLQATIATPKVLWGEIPTLWIAVAPSTMHSQAKTRHFVWYHFSDALWWQRFVRHFGEEFTPTKSDYVHLIDGVSPSEPCRCRSNSTASLVGQDFLFLYVSFTAGSKTR